MIKHYWASIASESKTSSASGRLSQAMNIWLEHRLPNWQQIWAVCSARTHSWRVPPRWSLRDWWEEIDAESVAAACQAIRIFDPNRGCELASFVYGQILGGALSRYRQEWTYAVRYGLAVGEAADVPAPDEPFAITQDSERLKKTLTELTEADSSLIKQIYWEGRTETEFAGGLGISQQAVNKRKQKILDKLRKSLTGTVEPRRPRKRTHGMYRPALPAPMATT